MKKNKQIVNLLLEYGIAVVLLLLIIIFATQSSNFLSVNTVMTILKQVSITGIISVGMTFVILTGGIDLSVGSIAGGRFIRWMQENRTIGLFLRK